MREHAQIINIHARFRLIGKNLYGKYSIIVTGFNWAKINIKNANHGFIRVKTNKGSFQVNIIIVEF